MISVNEAWKKMMDVVIPLGVVEKPLEAVVGATLAETLVADRALPPFNNSAMDGYAIQTKDVKVAKPETPIWLDVIGEVPAGQVFEKPLQSGQAVKIMTGAQVPPSADAVVMLEKARYRNGKVEVREPVTFGKHIRSAGEDIAAGEEVLSAGTPICIQHLGLLASLGRASLRVYQKPSVALLTTGSELVKVGQKLSPGKIYDSNGLVLRKLLEQTGVTVEDLGATVDDPQRIYEALQRTQRHDLLVISGGVSVGKYDYVKKALQEFGMKTIFWRVKMKPGKPILFGQRDRQWIFGLPGNPISCVVGFLVFVQPVLQRMMGVASPKLPLIRAVLRKDVVKKDERQHYLTAIFTEEKGEVIPTKKQGSGMLVSLSQANAFIIIPEDKQWVRKGEKVDVLRFSCN